MFKLQASAFALMAITHLLAMPYALADTSQGTATGIIKFTGVVSGNTCIIRDDGLNQNIQMGNMNIADFDDASRLTPKNFSINFSSCPNNQRISIAFDSKLQNGILPLTPSANAATNIAIALNYNDVALANAIETSSGSTGSTGVQLSAQYKKIAAGSVTPGDANAELPITVTYY